MLKRTYRMRWSAILLIGFLVQGGLAEEAVEDIPDDIRALPQFSGDKPPTPLSSMQEEAVLDAVFLRFPDLDRHLTMTFIRKHFPEGSRDFTLMSQRDLGKAMALLIDLVGQSDRLMTLQKRNPAHFAKVINHRGLERKIDSLAGELKDLASLEASESETRLRTVLSESFLLKQDLMKSDIEHLETQLETLRDLLKKREVNREVIIDNRFLDIIGKLDHMKW